METTDNKRAIRSWVMYDWANSAFATTIMAAVLPVYYAQVAGATLGGTWLQCTGRTPPQSPSLLQPFSARSSAPLPISAAQKSDS